MTLQAMLGVLWGISPTVPNSITETASARKKLKLEAHHELHLCVPAVIL